MKQPLRPFATNHEDIVLDVEYDFYGRQLATCSADQHIKVFDLDPETMQWVPNDSWKAHDSAVVRVRFADPQFGHLLLSASYDRTLKIWQEDFEVPVGTSKRWARLATINDSHGPLYDACFLPAFLGLKAGSIGSDGKLRIYENINPSNLCVWGLVEEIDVLKAPVASHLQSDFNLSWCPSRFSTEMVCVSALDQAYVYYKDESTNKYRLGKLLPEHNGLIRSVAWAPLMGRSYHLIATACKDGFVRIFKLVEKPRSSPSAEFEIDVTLISSFNEKAGEIWRVCWNETGTILSSCGDDGYVRLYKASYANNFQCMSVISAKSIQ